MGASPSPGQLARRDSVTADPGQAPARYTGVPIMQRRRWVAHDNPNTLSARDSSTPEWCTDRVASNGAQIYIEARLRQGGLAGAFHPGNPCKRQNQLPGMQARKGIKRKTLEPPEQRPAGIRTVDKRAGSDAIAARLSPFLRGFQAWMQRLLVVGRPNKQYDAKSSNTAVRDICQFLHAVAMGRVTPLALRGGVAARGDGFETVVLSCVLMCDDLPEAASAWASGEIEDARVDTFGKALSLGTASVVRILKHVHW